MTTLATLQVSVVGAPHHGHPEPTSTQAALPAGALVLGPLLFAILVAVGILLVRHGLIRRTAAVVTYLSVAVLAAGALTVTVAARQPDPPAAPGVPLLHSLALGGRQVPVLVVPNRPGFNLVGIGTADAKAGPDRDRLAAGTARPGSAQTWIGVDLPSGPGRLWVSAGGADGSLPVDTGTGSGPAPAALRGPDGPECASAVAGALLAGGAGAPRACPADELSTSDAAALRSVVRFLAGRGERVVAVAGDDSARGRAADAEVRAAAAAERVAVVAPGADVHPLIIVAGWAGAEDTMRSVGAGRIGTRGSYLAPWLLTPSLLRPSAGQLIALRYEPRDPVAAEYLGALTARMPGEPPSPAGFEAWRRARGQVPAAPARLYAAAVPYIPGSGGATGHHHHETAADWLPGGMIFPVTGPLSEP